MSSNKDFKIAISVIYWIGFQPKTFRYDNEIDLVGINLTMVNYTIFSQYLTKKRGKSLEK